MVYFGGKMLKTKLMDKIEQTKKIINLTQLAIQEIDTMLKSDITSKEWLEFTNAKIEFNYRIGMLDSLIEKWS